MYPVLVESYIAAKRVEDAFNAGSSWLETSPNEVGALYLLSVTGADEARRNNPKYVQQSQQYGLKAIQLIEADQRPASIDAATWARNKNLWLPQLYQSLGFISMLGGSTTEALTRLQKAATLNPADPFNYALIGDIKNQDYEQMAKLYSLMPAGAEKEQLLGKINTRLDEIIDAYAHAVASAQGRPEYKPLYDQLLTNLQNYYKFRHKSTDGLQQLIDKYKPTTATTTTPSTPQ
jgi:tetratricopeptide (TPR) repeat protein